MKVKIEGLTFTKPYHYARNTFLYETSVVSSQQREQDGTKPCGSKSNIASHQRLTRLCGVAAMCPPPRCHRRQEPVPSKPTVVPGPNQVLRTAFQDLREFCFPTIPPWDICTCLYLFSQYWVLCHCFTNNIFPNQHVSACC